MKRKIVSAFKDSSGQWRIAKLPVNISKSGEVKYPTKVFYRERHYNLENIRNRALYKEAPLLIELKPNENGVEEKLEFLNNRLDAQQNQINSLIEVSKDYAEIIKLLNYQLKELGDKCEKLESKPLIN